MKTAGDRPIGSTPFRIAAGFINTPPATWLMAFLEEARRNGTSHVISGVTGIGKSTACEEYAYERSLEREGSTVRQRVLFSRVTRQLSPRTDGALALAFARELGHVPRSIKGPATLPYLADLIVRRRIEQLILDDQVEFPKSVIRTFHVLLEMARQEARRQRGLIGWYPSLIVTSPVMYGQSPLVAFLADEREEEARQLRERLDGERPWITIAGLDRDGVVDTLGGYEDLYEDQFERLELRPWGDAIYGRLVDPLFNPELDGRVTMRNLNKYVLAVLSRLHDVPGTNLGPALFDESSEALLRQLRRTGAREQQSIGEESTLDEAWAAKHVV
jgi:hypothetical protein